MKVSVDCACQDKLFELSDVQKQVIANDINADVLHDDCCRRLQYILMHKYEQCFKRLKEEWDVKLAGRVASVPTDKDEYARLVFSQADYKDRKVRDAEEAAQQQSE